MVYRIGIGWLRLQAAMLHRVERCRAPQQRSQLAGGLKHACGLGLFCMLAGGLGLLRGSVGGGGFFLCLNGSGLDFGYIGFER